MKTTLFILLAGILFYAQASLAQSVFDKHRVAFKKADDKVHFLLIGDRLYKFTYRNNFVEEVQFQSLNKLQPQTIRYVYENLLISSIDYPGGTISVIRDSGKAREIRFPDNDTIKLSYSKGVVSNIALNRSYSIPIFSDKNGKLLDPKFDTTASSKKTQLLNQLELYNWLRSLTDINGILNNQEYHQPIFSGVERTGGKESFPFTELTESDLVQLQKSFPNLVAKTSGFNPYIPIDTVTPLNAPRINCCPKHVELTPEAGVTLANMNTDSNGRSSSGDVKTGLRIGLNVRIPIGRSFFIEPGAFYSLKGMNGFYGNPNRGFSDVTLHYFEIPLNFSFTYPLFGLGCFDFGLGGHFAVAAAGTGKLVKSSPPGQVEDLTFGTETENDFSNFDYGAQAFAGYKLKNGLFVRVCYQYGLANIVPADIAEFSGKKAMNRCWNFTSGWQIQ